MHFTYTVSMMNCRGKKGLESSIQDQKDKKDVAVNEALLMAPTGNFSVR